MCYEVNCGKCGKVTWGGCGRHVPSVYQRIAEGQHCMCREWPGVNLTATTAAAAASSSSGGTTAEAAAAAPAPQSAPNCGVL